MATFTEAQRAFQIRKMKARFRTLDITQNGYVSDEDYYELCRRTIEYAKLNPEQAARLKKATQNICDMINLKPGTKMRVEEFIESTLKFAEDPEKFVPLGKASVSVFFDVIDTDADGVITLEEFKLYRKFANIGEEQAKAVFDAIDTNSDGKISRDDFTEAVVYFYCYCDPANPCNFLYGPLVD